jgi:hypothetical protein
MSEAPSFPRFCLGWPSYFVGSESGQKQRVKLLQKMVSNRTQTPSPSQPHTLWGAIVHKAGSKHQHNWRICRQYLPVLSDYWKVWKKERCSWVARDTVSITTIYRPPPFWRSLENKDWSVKRLKYWNMKIWNWPGIVSDRRARILNKNAKQKTASIKTREILLFSEGK